MKFFVLEFTYNRQILLCRVPEATIHLNFTFCVLSVTNYLLSQLSDMHQSLRLIINLITLTTLTAIKITDSLKVIKLHIRRSCNFKTLIIRSTIMHFTNNDNTFIEVFWRNTKVLVDLKVYRRTLYAIQIALYANECILFGFC